MSQTLLCISGPLVGMRAWAAGESEIYWLVRGALIPNTSHLTLQTLHKADGMYLREEAVIDGKKKTVLNWVPLNTTGVK